MVSVIETPFRTALMAGLGGLHRATAGQETAACRAVGVAAVARRTDREETVAPATGLLAEGLVHGVGVRRMTSDWTASPNRDTTIPTGSVCRRARWSRGSGGQVRALTYVCVPPVRYPKHRGHTTAGAMDAAAGVDAHDAPTPACLQNRPEGGFAQAPTVVLIGQLGVNTRRPVRVVRTPVDRMDQGREPDVLHGPGRQRPPRPRIESAGGDAQQPAHDPNRIGGLIRFHEPEDRFVFGAVSCANPGMRTYSGRSRG